MPGELLYPYSLVPVLSVSVLLFFASLRRRPIKWGLTMYCLTLSVWSGMLGALWIESIADFAEKFAAVGAFIAAGYLHVAYEVTQQKKYALVYFAYFVATVLTLGGVLFPGLQYGPRAMQAGPLFWPSMGLAVVAAVVPLWHLYRSYQSVEPGQRSVMNRLALGGILTYVGGTGNAMLLAHGHPRPYPMFLVLGGLFVLAYVVKSGEAPAERRLLERSLVYSTLTAILSAGFLFGVVTLMDEAGTPLRQYRFSALFLLMMAAIAFEPIRQQLQERIGKRVVPDRASATDVSRALDAEKARADQAQRLAEIGQLTSAVAHEVRNPLGVLKAHLALLARQDVDPEILDAMTDQIERASMFVEDLLRYGRPRPPDLRIVDAVATAELALSTARQGAGFDTSSITTEVVTDDKSTLLIEADQAQLQQVLVILIDNALLALSDRDAAQIRVRLTQGSHRIRVTVEDNGPGIPEAVQDRLFQPFVTSRKREGPRTGTGLGLAIATGIVERHHGTLSAGPSKDLGGARFDLELLEVQPVLSKTEIHSP